MVQKQQIKSQKVLLAANKNKKEAFEMSELDGIVNRRDS